MKRAHGKGDNSVVAESFIWGWMSCAGRWVLARCRLQRPVSCRARRTRLPRRPAMPAVGLAASPPIGKSEQVEYRMTRGSSHAESRLEADAGCRCRADA